MDISKVLDEAKEKLGTTSDYAFAQKSGIRKAYISMYRKGQRTPGPYECGKLAEILERDPWQLMAEFEASTEKNDERRAYWQKIAERMAGATMAGLLVFTALPQKAEAAGNHLTSCRLLFSEVTRLANRGLSQALLRLLVLITTRPALAQS